MSLANFTKPHTFAVNPRNVLYVEPDPDMASVTIVMIGGTRLHVQDTYEQVVLMLDFAEN